MSSHGDRKFGFQGLYTDAAALTAPPGALRTAVGVAIRRPGVITARERTVGFEPPIRQDEIPGDEQRLIPATHVGRYKGRMVVFRLGEVDTPAGASVDHWPQQVYTVTSTSGTGGISTTIIATYSTAVAASLQTLDGYFTQSAEARGHFYFTTKFGVRRLNSPSGTDTPLTGLRQPDALEGPPVTLSTRDTVYRTTVRRTTESGLVLRSPPSAPVLSRAPTTLQQYTVGFATGDTVEVYRSPDKFATDDVQLFVERTLTASDISRGRVEIDDIDNRPLGAFIYTAQTQEGILQRNDRPPRCGTMAFYQNSMFFGNCGFGKEVIITLQPNRQNTTWDGWPRPGFAKGISTVMHTSGSSIVTLNSPGNLLTGDIGMKVLAGFLPSDGASIVSFDQSVTRPTEYRLSVAASSTGTTAVSVYDVMRVAGESFFPGFSTHFSVATGDSSADFMAKFANCVNRTSSKLGAEPLFTVGTTTNNETYSVRVYELDTVTSSSVYVTPRVGYRGVDPEGELIQYYDNTIDFTGDSNKLTIWSGAPDSMEDTARRNRLMWSKPFQPEHVPRFNQTFVGSEDYRIQRIVPTRDALYVFKEDGIWILTGDEGGGNFPPGWTIRPLDPSLSLLTPDTAIAFEERVYGIFTRGIYVVSPGGAADIGVGRIDDKTSEATLQLMRRDQKSHWYAGMAVNSYDNEVLFALPSTQSTPPTFGNNNDFLEGGGGFTLTWNTDTQTWVSGDFFAAAADFPEHPGPLLGRGDQDSLPESDGSGRVFSTAVNCEVEVRGASGMAPDGQKRFTDVLFYFDNANSVAGVRVDFTSSNDDAEDFDQSSIPEISRSSGNSATVRAPVPRDHSRATELYPYLRLSGGDWSMVACTVLYYPYSKRVRRK